MDVRLVGPRKIKEDRLGAFPDVLFGEELAHLGRGSRALGRREPLRLLAQRAAELGFELRGVDAHSPSIVAPLADKSLDRWRDKDRKGHSVWSPGFSRSGVVSHWISQDFKPS